MKPYKVQKNVFAINWNAIPGLQVVPVDPAMKACADKLSAKFAAEVMAGYVQSESGLWIKEPPAGLSLLSGMPMNVSNTTCSYSSAKVDMQTMVDAMQKARQWMERQERREREVLTIAGRLMMAGITGDRYRLAECLWMAEQCFERSLEVLAQHHRLGRWAQKRLA